MSYNPVNTDSRSNSPVPFDRHYLPYGQQPQQRRYASFDIFTLVPFSICDLWFAAEDTGAIMAAIRRKQGTRNNIRGMRQEERKKEVESRILPSLLKTKKKEALGLQRIRLLSHKQDG